MENQNTEIAVLQTLDVAQYAGLLTSFKAKFEVHKGTVERGLKVAYSPETKPKFDALVQLIKKDVSAFEAERKVFTKKLDEVKGLFPAAEKEMLALIEPLAKMELDWKRAEKAKQDEEDALRQKEATRIRLVAEFVPKVESILVDFKHEIKCDILERSQAGEEVPAWEFSQTIWQGLCKRAMLAMGGQDFANDLAAAIAPKKDELIQEAGKEIAAFQAEVTKSMGNDKALKSLGRTLGVSYQEAVVQAADNADAAKVEAEMEIAQVVQETAPAVQINTKFIPTPVNHKEVMEIFRHWLVNENPTVEDAYAQIGKAMTYCKRQALKGVKFGGVTYIEDVK